MEYIHNFLTQNICVFVFNLCVNIDPKTKKSRYVMMIAANPL